jgi:ADP-heptose:LPS heptosyltransferase
MLDLPAGNRVVVINPGAKSHLKRWGALKFAALADRLTAELGCTVFVCGNEDDREVVGKVMSQVKGKARDLCCKTSVGVLSEIMRKCSLVVTNDSAPLHLASAVNAPTVAIFGPSSEVKYGPLSDKSRVIKPDVPCRPCEKALCAIGPDEGCIGRVTVEEVFAAAKELLGEV